MTIGSLQAHFKINSEGTDNIQEPDRTWDRSWWIWWGRYIREKLLVSVLFAEVCMVLGWTSVKELSHYLWTRKLEAAFRNDAHFLATTRIFWGQPRRVHPRTRPAYADPSRQRAWCCLEHQQDYGDTLGAIRPAMPGAIILGDYVIDNGNGLSHNHEFGESNGP